MNSQLARSLASAPVAANVSYLVGFLALAVLLLTQRFDHPDWLALPKAPHWSLTGGIFGAWYIASSAYFISALGTTLTLGFVVFGQAMTGIIADHFGWLGLPHHRLTGYRRIAIGLFMVALFFLKFAYVPWWAYLGGLLGATFVSLSTLTVPKLGLTTATLAVVCSQMIMSLVIDQYGFLRTLSPVPLKFSGHSECGLC